MRNRHSISIISMIGIYRDDHLHFRLHPYRHCHHLMNTFPGLWSSVTLRAGYLFIFLTERCVLISQSVAVKAKSCSNPKGWHGSFFIQHFLVHGFSMFRLLWVELLVTRLLIPFCWNNAWDDAAVATSWESRASADNQGRLWQHSAERAGSYADLNGSCQQAEVQLDGGSCFEWGLCAV